MHLRPPNLRNVLLLIATVLLATERQLMFDISRKALEDMATYIPGYHGAVARREILWRADL
jgi:hypothetical protein